MHWDQMPTESSGVVKAGTPCPCFSTPMFFPRTDIWAPRFHDRVTSMNGDCKKTGHPGQRLSTRWLRCTPISQTGNVSILWLLLVLRSGLPRLHRQRRGWTLISFCQRRARCNLGGSQFRNVPDGKVCLSRTLSMLCKDALQSLL
jgi:hypothetical protein